MSNEEGNEINPHIPQFMSQAPWYLNQDAPGLKHQRNLKEKKPVATATDFVPRGRALGDAATAFRKGACTNCGAMTHKAADCVERPRKKGAKYSEFANDPAAQQAVKDLRTPVAQDAELHCIDYAAAADPSSDRPLKLFIDCSGFAWGCTLAQRENKTAAPRPVAVYSRSLTATEQASSAFERELYAYREALAATHHLCKEFLVVAYTDHKNSPGQRPKGVLDLQ